MSTIGDTRPLVDAFEQVVAELVRAEGYWVRTDYKVTLTSEQKRDILRPSAPRWELDLVGYKPATNQLRVLECKSYLDSRGVDAAHFIAGAKLAGRYKLFHSDPLRDVILKALVLQLANEGLCRADPNVEFGLVYGNAAGSEAALQKHFAARGWALYGPDWIQGGLKKLRKAGYQNSIAAVVSKLLA